MAYQAQMHEGGNMTSESGKGSREGEAKNIWTQRIHGPGKISCSGGKSAVEFSRGK